MHGDLYDMVHESMVKTVSGEQAEKAFSADGGNFDASPILHTFEKRHQAAVDEIGVFDRGTACIDHVAGCKLNVLALPQHLLANFARQRKKNAIEDFFACATQRTAPTAEYEPTLMSTFAFLRRGGQVKGRPGNAVYSAGCVVGSRFLPRRGPSEASQRAIT